MVIALVLTAVVAVALTLAVVRLRGRVQEQARADVERRERIASLNHDLNDARMRSADLEASRDQALEQVSRARRDASEVATRLSELRREHEDVQVELASTATDYAALDARCRELEAQAATANGAGGEAGGDDWAAVTWALTLARVDRLWRVAVVAGTAAASPLLESDNRFVTAVEILIDAAREEAGALIERHLVVHGVPRPPVAVGAFAVLEELVAAATRDADSAELTITVGTDAIEITVDAIDGDGNPVVVPGPDALSTAPGRFRIGRSDAASLPG